jgi:hypothetical protein
MTYSGWLESGAIKLVQPALPPIFPLVLYGICSLERSHCVQRLFVSLYSIMEYQFNAKYAVIDIGRLPLEKYHFSEDNLILSLIGLERSKSQVQISAAVLSKISKHWISSTSPALKPAYQALLSFEPGI